jgi:hypothetical protein
VSICGCVSTAKVVCRVFDLSEIKEVSHDHIFNNTFLFIKVWIVHRTNVCIFIFPHRIIMAVISLVKLLSLSKLHKLLFFNLFYMYVYFFFLPSVHSWILHIWPYCLWVITYKIKVFGWTEWWWWLLLLLLLLLLLRIQLCSVCSSIYNSCILLCSMLSYQPNFNFLI